MHEPLLKELREVRPTLYRLDGVLVTPKAAEVMGRTDTTPSSLIRRYDEDISRHRAAELIGYKLSNESGLDSETCAHVAFDPELGKIIIYEEW